MSLLQADFLKNQPRQRLISIPVQSYLALLCPVIITFVSPSLNEVMYVTVSSILRCRVRYYDRCLLSASQDTRDKRYPAFTY